MNNAFTKGKEITSNAFIKTGSNKHQHQSSQRNSKEKKNNKKVKPTQTGQTQIKIHPKIINKVSTK
jgi:hypothetical protein